MQGVNKNPTEKDPLALENNADIEILQEPAGEPEPDCCSSYAQCRYRTWDCLARWRYILLGS